MREYKFRYVMKSQDLKETLIMSFTLEEIEENGLEWIYEQFEKEYGGECNCLNESCNHCECSPVFDEHKIISRDRYTGLKDKNGKEIYEGDIFIFNDIVSIVKWSKSGYSIKRDKDYYIDKYYYCTLSAKCELGEVIGNIYENKDLI